MSGAGVDGQGSTATWSLNWSYTVHLETGPVVFSLNRPTTEDDNPHVESLIPWLDWTGEIPDERAEWHHNYTPIDRWFRAHLLRCIRDDTHQDLVEALEDDRALAAQLGFFEGKASVIDEYDETGAGHGVPGYTQVRNMWEEEFSDRTRGACMVLAERLVEYARDQGFPAPDQTFVPDHDVEIDDDDVDEDHPTVRELTTKYTTDIWKTSKPIVLNYWSLNRHHNYQVPDHVFLDAQATMATGDDVFPESGVGNLVAAGEHDRVHYPSTHRRELKRLSVPEIRELMKNVARDLIGKARSKGELVGKLAVSIDITKGHPWTGHVEKDGDDNNVEPWILGYLHDNDTRTQYYFQWASVQVVGLDIPLVLDAVPVRRGMPRGDIVDELLDTATDLVQDIEICYMDRGFDSTAVKNASDEHDVWYLNGARVEKDDDTPDEMREEGDAFRLETQQTLEEDRPNRKTLYLPSAASWDGDSDDDDDEEEKSQKQKLIQEYDLDEEQFDEQTLEKVVETIRELVDVDEVVEDEGSDGEMPIAKFETNHPYIEEHPDNEREMQHMIARHVRRYGNRWGVENGFKKVKQFLPRSGSSDHVLRFLNFAFASVMYNCWRLVDLLVKLEVEDEPDYVPLVTAQRFRSIAEGHYGLAGIPPPDW